MRHEVMMRIARLLGATEVGYLRWNGTEVQLLFHERGDAPDANLKNEAAKELIRLATLQITGRENFCMSIAGAEEGKPNYVLAAQAPPIGFDYALVVICHCDSDANAMDRLYKMVELLLLPDDCWPR
jgi:hypothetical protein